MTATNWSWILTGAAALAAMLVLGCELEMTDPLRGADDDGSTADVGAEAAPAAENTAEEAAPAAEDTTEEPDPAPGGTVWLDADVSGWAETSRLNAYVRGDMIVLDHSKAHGWPGVNGVNGNAWVLVDQGGKTYAATFEYLRVGQTSKPTRTVNGDHINYPPLNSFRPRSGETYGFMVSGLARSKTRNVSERSNIAYVTWP